jgi:glycosyltransferase involved in cell wall biosynthesis
MLKITFLTGEYPPMQGGIADHIAYLARHMMPLDVESTILIHRRWQQTEPVITAMVRTEAPASEVVVHPVISEWDRHCWPAIVTFLKTHQPDVLHIQYQAAAFDLGGWINWLPLYLKTQRLKTRVVTTFHDLRVPYLFPKAGPLRWWSMLALARHSHAVICTNRDDLQRLRRQIRKHGLHATAFLKTHTDPARSEVAARAASSQTSRSPRLSLIPLGSNVEPQPPADFDRTAWRKMYRATAETLLLAYFGFLNESKGGEELIEALALLRQHGLDAHLLLIGGDIGHADPTNVEYARRVQALIERHGLAAFVHRTGYVDLAQVSANLLAADAVVMPYRDGVSFRRTTLIAALRHGCPVVSTTPADASLVPEIVPGENMLLASPCDAIALAHALVTLAEDRRLRARLSAGAEQLGALFDWTTIAAETAALYQAVTSAST